MEHVIQLYEKVKHIYEAYYDIHICSLNEIEDVLSFIDTYWQKGHILTKSRRLLDWQHLDKEKHRYNFVLARVRETGEIHGLIGFISSEIYDSKITTPIRWGAIWKVRNDVAIPGLGIALKGYLEKEVPAKYIGGVGLSVDSKRINAKLGERMGKLCQYYIANAELKDYQLIQEPEFLEVETKQLERSFVQLQESEYICVCHLLEKKLMPYKSVTYYVNRYFRHPIYEYSCIGIQKQQKENEKETLKKFFNRSPLETSSIEAIFFYRKCVAEQRSCLFLVDYIGDGSELLGAKKAFGELLKKEKAEYISFPCTGISPEQMKSAGFAQRDTSNVTLPVYYEPFLRQNVDLDFHFWADEPIEPLIVKGDADQDRPNRL